MARKEKNGIHYTFWRQSKEEPSGILGYPGCNVAATNAIAEG